MNKQLIILSPSNNPSHSLRLVQSAPLLTVTSQSLGLSSARGGAGPSGGSQPWPAVVWSFFSSHRGEFALQPQVGVFLGGVAFNMLTF